MVIAEQLNTYLTTNNEVLVETIRETAPKKTQTKRIAMFIIPVNNESTSIIYSGFELKASTNNFQHSSGKYTSSELNKLVFYGQSSFASRSNTYSYEGCTYHNDLMNLYISNYTDGRDVRSYSKFNSTMGSTGFTSIVVLIDTNCLKYDNSDWLRDDNEDLIWCYIRQTTDNVEKNPINSYHNLWRPISPVRWFSEWPSWAGNPISE